MKDAILIILIIIAVVAAVLLYDKGVRYHSDKIVDLYEDSLLNARAHLDSMENVVVELERHRLSDSILTAMRLESNSRQIQRLQNNASKVSFREYSDHQLDSILAVLYPRPDTTSR